MFRFDNQEKLQVVKPGPDVKFPYTFLRGIEIEILKHWKLYAAKGPFSGASEANAIRGKLGTSIKDHTFSISKYNIDNLKYFSKYRVRSVLTLWHLL